MSNTNQLIQLVRNSCEFDKLTLPKRQKIAIRRANLSDLSPVSQFAQSALPDGIAGCAAIGRVIELNRNSVLLFERGRNVVGFWAMLMLTSQGLERLLLNELDTLDPEPVCIARTMERPAAIYSWAVVAPRLAAEGVFHVSQFLRKPSYRHANMYARPNTPEGVRFNLKLGSRPLSTAPEGLYRYVRLANRAKPFAHAA